MAYFEKRGSKVRASVFVNGTKHNKTCDTRKDAEIWARGMEHKKDRGDVVELLSRDTLASVIDRYETKEGNWGHDKRHHLKHLRTDLGHLPLAKLNTTVVCDYIVKLDVQPNNARKRLAYLASAMRHAKYILRLSVRLSDMADARAELKAGKVIGRALARTKKTNQVEIERIIEGHTYDDRSIDLPEIIEVLSVLPIRVGELCKIKWTDIDEVNRTALLRQRKHPDPKVKERNDELIPLPKVGNDLDTFDLIFTNRKKYGNQAGPFPYDVTQASEAMITARVRAGLHGEVQDNLHIHDLRAHAITGMVRAGINPLMVMIVSGHKDMATFYKHYVRFDIEDVRKDIERQLAGGLSMSVKAKLAGIDLDALRQELRAELRQEMKLAA